MLIDHAVIPLQESSSYFLPSQLESLNFSRIPQHIAIIPDGNRRWARKRLSSSNEGHREGADILMETVKAAKELGIKAITFYTFSTENWSRSFDEISALMLLFASYLSEQCDSMIQNGIKLETIGELDPLPEFLKDTLKETKKATCACDQIDLILAMNYGSRNELQRAFTRILDEVEQGNLKKEEVNETTIAQYLDTHQWPDPELLIRTSGEMRISNFLLWQISYTEIYIAPVLWPDFTPNHLLEAIVDYQKRERRWGGV
ncbi:polyprenyl diphosphate synthase [Candidatus Protochlamydia amoebophila]|uniref:polyprenyl diphosphate synthase n=1 Tax=Candidatus Protochlamydia amoebophila TaxID=362787 RepID=UPI0002E1F249|nr:polyprenyl diphosphate synthase [Candidatus Protochlamydia amoebophila]